MLLIRKQQRRITDIPIVQIRPCKTQARTNYSPDNLRELSYSIKQNGIIQPIIVRKISASEYELIAGERRLRAAAMCGKTKVPCIIISCSDSEAEVYSLVENLQRADLNCFEEARGIDNLLAFGELSEKETSRRIVKTKSALENKLRILALTEEEKALIIKARLTERHALALLRITDALERRMILSEIIEYNMNVSQSEKYIESYLQLSQDEKKQRQKNKAIIKDKRIFENTINHAVGSMRSFGISATSKQTESDTYIEYTVRIPK